MGSSVTLTVQSIVKKETSPVNFDTYQITAGNIAAWDAEWATYKTTLDAIIIGVIRDEDVKVYDNLLDAAMPASDFARRELKLLVRYHEVTSGAKFRSEIPCPDLTALTLESGDANFVNLADAGVMAAWVTAAEAIMRSPDDPTEAILIDSAQVVGRNI